MQSVQSMTSSFRLCQPISARYRWRPSRGQACKISNCTEVAVHTEGLVFSRGGPDAWDSAAVGSPVVRCYMGDNEQRWYMWYSGSSKPLPGLAGVSPAAGSIGVAVSFDGISWLRGDGTVEGHQGAAKASDVGIVLAPNTGNWWTLDTAHLTVSDVQVLSNNNVSSGVGVYWMFYSGGDFEAVPAPEGLLRGQEGDAVEGLRMRPGLAMSQDGRNWARIEADHHTGALFDVGQPGEWDSHYIGHPQVVAAGPSDMRMYYHSYDAAAGKFKVGIALSRDGFSWKKSGVIFEGGQAGDFDSGGAAACQVVSETQGCRAALGKLLTVAIVMVAGWGLLMTHAERFPLHAKFPVLLDCTSNTSRSAAVFDHQTATVRLWQLISRSVEPPAGPVTSHCSNDWNKLCSLSLA